MCAMGACLGRHRVRASFSLHLTGTSMAGATMGWEWTMMWMTGVSMSDPSEISVDIEELFETGSDFDNDDDRESA